MKPQRFTINLVDLDNVIQEITNKKPAGGAIELVDDSVFIVIRDTNGMQISSVVKVTENETHPHQ